MNSKKGVKTNELLKSRINPLIFNRNIKDLINDENDCDLQTSNTSPIIISIDSSGDDIHNESEYCFVNINQSLNQNSNKRKSINFDAEENVKKERKSFIESNESVGDQKLFIEYNCKQLKILVEKKVYLKCNSIGCGVVCDGIESYVKHMDFHLFVRRQRVKQMVEKRKSMICLRDSYKQTFNQNESLYVCIVNECGYKSKHEKTICDHIIGQHLELDADHYECNECNQTYKHYRDLYKHLKYHLCGFGMNEERNGFCDDQSLKKFYVEKRCGRNKRLYGCTFCTYSSRYHSNAKRHVHDQHICLFRHKLNQF